MTTAMTDQLGAPPLVDELVVRELVADRLHQDTKAAARSSRSNGPRRERMILVHGRYASDAKKAFKVEGAEVTVRDCPSVLAVLEASLEHQARGGDGWLVVLTPRQERELGNDLLARAVRGKKQQVSLWQIVAQRLGAAGYDGNLRRGRDAWIAPALLDAVSQSGWRPLPGAILTREAALLRLAHARLGLGDGDIAPDAAELLTWSSEPSNARCFMELDPTESEGLGGWLATKAGASGEVFRRLIERGRGADVLPFGLVADLLWHSDVPSGEEAGSARGAAQSALLGGAFAAARDPSYAQAACNAAIRRITAATIPGARRERDEVNALLERADRIVAEIGAAAIAANSNVLETGLDARLRTLGKALTRACAITPARNPRAIPSPAALTEVEAAWTSASIHTLAELRAERLEPAETAVRVLRWLATEPEAPKTVAAGVRTHLAEWGWVDRALDVLWHGGPPRDAELGNAYRAVYEAAQARRAEIDAGFAAKLAAWTANSAASTELLLVEDVLDRIVAPLAAAANAPLVLVLDAMASAVAVELGEEITASGWLEIGLGAEHPARTAALAMIPSITAVSRSSLLSGTPAEGGQDVERRGFAAFWKPRGRNGVVFHKAGLEGAAGRQLSDSLSTALSLSGSEPQVVAVVLNTIDDALDHGRQNNRSGWRIEHVKHLPELLDEARRHGRPIVVTADHGHVLERGTGDIAPEDATAARWRTVGSPGDGEVLLEGPRVAAGDGRIVAAVREHIRYTNRKAGYHGGASLAEMTVPVMVFAPRGIRALPHGWMPLGVEHVQPPWWSRGATAGGEAPIAPVAPRSAKAKREAPMAEGLFSVADVTLKQQHRADTLGARLRASPLFKERLKLVARQRLDTHAVSALVDAFESAGGTLSLPRIAEITAVPAFRVSGWLVVVRTVLNVESYQVLSPPDRQEMAELDLELLRRQFGIPSS